MSDTFPLYNICLSSDQLAALIQKIRSTNYIEEVESGERPREESSLWSIIQPVEDGPGDTASIESIVSHSAQSKARPAAIVIADDRSMASVRIIHIEAGKQVDEMKTAPGDVIEVCCTLASKTMTLTQLKSMADARGIYDSGR